MRICVIGGANVDITATSGRAFQFGDSNPGTVQVSWGGVGRNIAHNLALPCIVKSVTGGGDALLAGIVHAGVDAPIAETARWGLECARCAVESPDAVSDRIKDLRL